MADKEPRGYEAVCKLLDRIGPKEDHWAPLSLRRFTPFIERGQLCVGDLRELIADYDRINDWLTQANEMNAALTVDENCETIELELPDD